MLQPGEVAAERGALCVVAGKRGVTTKKDVDFLNDRLLSASCAIVHVVVNHAMAVGGIPRVALLEWGAWRARDADGDRSAHRIMSAGMSMVGVL